MINNMKVAKCKWMGISPLLMNSNQTVNPFHPVSVQKKPLTSKRKKTEEDILKLLDLDYEGSLYYDSDVGVYVPAICVEATLRNGAKKIRKGSDVKSCVFVSPDFIELIYDGPSDLEGLLKDDRFKDVRPVVVQRASMLKCRPRFDKWEINFDLTFDPKIFNDEDIELITDIAGRQIGLCDYRPRYGRFEAIISM